MECNDCKKQAKLKACETHNPKLAKICKDCCISRGGHTCRWFELCW